MSSLTSATMPTAGAGRQWTALAVIIAILTVPSTGAAQRNCTKGKPCGNTCIAQHLTCRVGASPPSPSASPETGTDPNPSVPVSRLLGGSQTALGTPGTLSYCTTAVRTLSDLLIVSGPRPSGTIGYDVTSGAPLYAPSRGDTTPARLLSIHCPATSVATLMVEAENRIVMLDALSVSVRSAPGDPISEGNIKVRSGNEILTAFVWLSAYGTASLQAEHGRP